MGRGQVQMRSQMFMRQNNPKYIVLAPMLAAILLVAVGMRDSVASDIRVECEEAAIRVSDQYLQQVHASFTTLMPVTHDVLTEHHVKAFFSREGKKERVEIVLDNVRRVEVPHSSETLVEYLETDKAFILTDKRSRLEKPWAIDEATVLAADVAYEIEIGIDDEHHAFGRLDPEIVAKKLPGYVIRAIYVDAFAGFSGVVLEPRQPSGGGRYRIYAVAGSHVFYNTDFRTWASGLTMARAQFVSGGALRMIKDAADYAQDLTNGGEVYITGQSQGGLTSQGIGYLLQVLLDGAQRPHHLVHVVSWGAVGAKETLIRLIESFQDGEHRGFWPEFERHWSFVDDGYREEMEVWTKIESVWQELPPAALDLHIRKTAARMRVVGYFFEIDLFARAGTFLGTPMVFPTVLVLPDACETLVAERVTDSSGGEFGVSLESHFLNGYQRAVRRGAVGLARPALPKKWQWVLDVMPTAEHVGMLWLTKLYLERIGASEANWRQCFAARKWITDRNRDCEKTYWSGCSHQPLTQPETRQSVNGARWCLIEDGRHR